MAAERYTVDSVWSDFPSLLSGQLHMWHVSTEMAPKAIEKLEGVLSESELAKMSFFNFRAARDSFVISQGVLRKLLSNYLGVSPESVRIGRKSKGKPFSMDDQELYFNISHSGKFVVFAFSRDGEVGIDIERIRSIPDLEEMIARNFTAREIRFITAKPEERMSRFFRCWTLKESYLKAIGEGMRLSPDRIEIAVESDQVRHLSVQGVFEHEEWNFKEFELAGNYVGALAYCPGSTQIKRMTMEVA
jgi:4'-phosphopantetheinyl transferase